jgi:hypothetical protein
MCSFSQKDGIFNSVSSTAENVLLGLLKVIMTAIFCIAVYPTRNMTHCWRRVGPPIFIFGQLYLELHIGNSILMSLWVLYHLFTNAMRLKSGNVCWIYLVNDWKNFVPMISKMKRASVTNTDHT